MRPLGRDPTRVRIDAALGGVRRAVGWPARRLLDPRMDGLRNHVQAVAATIGDRIDVRASELGARIDALAERVETPVVGSNQSERSVVLPYVLGAIGTLTPGSAVVVADSAGGAVSTVLSSLGYEVLGTPLSESAPLVGAAVIRVRTPDHDMIEQAVRSVQPGGLVVLITEGAKHVEVEELLDGWEIEDETVTQQQRESVPSLALMRASLPASK